MWRSRRDVKEKRKLQKWGVFSLLFGCFFKKKSMHWVRRERGKAFDELEKYLYIGYRFKKLKSEDES